MQYRITITNDYCTAYISYIKRDTFLPVLVTSGGIKFFNLKKARKTIRKLKYYNYRLFYENKIRYNI